MKYVVITRQELLTVGALPACIGKFEAMQSLISTWRNLPTVVEASPRRSAPSLRTYHHLALVAQYGRISSVARLKLPERYESSTRGTKRIAEEYLPELYATYKTYISGSIVKIYRPRQRRNS